jgi:hypothetical protein
LCFVKKISPLIKSDGTFYNYVGVQEQKNVLRILRFDILRVAPYKFRLRRVKTCVLFRKIYPRSNLMTLLAIIGVQEQTTVLIRILKFDILRVTPIQIPT